MGLERSIITAVATAGLLTAGSCGGDDDVGGATTQTSAAEVRYLCPAAAAQPASDGPVQVTETGSCGFDDGLGYVTYGLVVQNTGDQRLNDVHVDVDMHSAGFTAARATGHHIYELEPGEDLGIGYFAPVQGASGEVALDVQVDVPEPFDDPNIPDGEMTVSDVSTAVEGSARTTTFTLTSTYPEAFNGVEVFVVYRDDAGAILGGEQSLVGTVEANGTVTHTVPSGYVNPTATQAEVYVNEHPVAPLPPA
jgi:hypothetical protein